MLIFYKSKNIIKLSLLLKNFSQNKNRAKKKKNRAKISFVYVSIYRTFCPAEKYSLKDFSFNLDEILNKIIFKVM